MAKIISTNEIVQTISNELKVYSTEVTEGIKKVNDECMEEFVADTKRDAPRGRRKNHYFRNITSKTTYETPNKKVNTWYVKDPEYRLTHLIAFGHATRNGGRTKAQDFITPNYNRLEQNFEEGIKEVIKNGH